MTPSARLSAAAEVLDQIATSHAPADAVLRTWGRAHRFAGSGDRRAIAERVYRCLRERAKIVQRMGADDGRALVLGSLVECDGEPIKEIEALYTGGGYGPAKLTQDERWKLTNAAPEASPPWVTAGVPEFVAQDLETTFGEDWIAEAQALVSSRAPVNLRVNGARASVADVEAELTAARIEFESAPWSAWALRLTGAPDVTQLVGFRQGHFEVQDESSQIAAWLAGAEPGMRVVDYCAGGGGKTLALGQCLQSARADSNRTDPNFKSAHPGECRDPDPKAPQSSNSVTPGLVPGAHGSERTIASGEGATSPHRSAQADEWAPGTSPGVTITGKVQPYDLGPGIGFAEPRFRRDERNKGELIALDVDEQRLDNIAPRLTRARVIAELRAIGPDGEDTDDLTAAADLVFVDAPCSGSGTWRRHPEDLWRLTPEDVARLHTLQTEILTCAAALVRPGGRLAYATCSVLAAENEATATAFEQTHPHFRPVPIAHAAAASPNLTPAARERLASLAGTGHRLRLSPRLTGTDGFFLALYERTA